MFLHAKRRNIQINMIDQAFVDIQQDPVIEDISIPDSILPVQQPSDIEEVPQQSWLAKLLRRMFYRGN